MKEIIIAALAIPFVITMTLLGIRFTETVAEDWKGTEKTVTHERHQYDPAKTCHRVYTKDMQPGDYIEICK